jgi:UDP-N-acetylmuramate--alanine ligase
VKIYCSGIGGIGLSAYASLQRVNGHEVLGSDRTESALLDDLRSQGISITLDQSGAAMPADIDLFVYSEAIPPEAPERMQAQALGIQQQSYPQALGMLTREYQSVIAVCGTHGKSSTTGIATRLLMHSGRDPTVVVGTKLSELQGRNWRKGRGDLFLLEACEYRHSFLSYHPSVILLTTCDGDHFDFYDSPAEYRQAFVRFVRELPESGTLITHMGDSDCRAVAEAAGRPTIDADAFPLIGLKTPGLHMRQNAQLVLALADLLKIPAGQAQSAVAGYAGSWRRMELKGTVNNVTVIDDYGHHPREIRATLDALIGEYPGRRIICVFQPHTHDRTRTLHEDFAKSFSGVHTVIVPNVYDARKHLDGERVDVPTLVRDISRASGVEAKDGVSLSQTEKMLRDGMLRDGDILLCLGAGDVTALASTMSSPPSGTSL